MNMRAFVLAETETGAHELATGARTLADEVVLCVIGSPAVTGAADECIHIDVPAGNIADDAYLTVNKAFDATSAQIVLAEQTTGALSLVGRLAAHVGTAAIGGAMEFADGAATSLYFGGVGVRTARAKGGVAIYAVDAGVFDAAAATGTDVVKDMPFEAPANAVAKIGTEALPASDVDLTGADVIVACGRGFSDEADLQMARELATKAGAEVGCTRPLTEAVDWFPREAYVGVSGQVVAPKVYIAVGVSGQMQHMVGCNRSTTVIAVNKDKNAPVFRQCDYGIVGDLKKVLPALTAAL